MINYTKRNIILKSKGILIAVLFMFISIFSFAGGIDELKNCFMNGNSKSLSSYLANNVTVNILTQKNNINKNEVGLLLANFAKVNKPKLFTISNQGFSKSEHTEFVIAELVTVNKVYQVAVTINASKLITEISIFY